MVGWQSRIRTAVFLIYWFFQSILVAIFWVLNLATLFSHRKGITESTPYVKVLGKVPGNIELTIFESEYYINAMLVSVGAAFIISVSILLPLLHWYYCSTSGIEYDPETHNLYLPETLSNAIESINEKNGSVSNVLLIIIFSGEIAYRFVTDVIRSIHYILPKHLAGLRIREANGEPLSASFWDEKAQDCGKGECDLPKVEEPKDEYYIRLGLQRVCAKGRVHGGVEDLKDAKNLLRIVEDFEQQEKILYALANVALTQIALGINIKELDHVSGADIYTRFGIVLAVFTIAYSSGPILKSSTYDRLKDKMKQIIIDELGVAAVSTDTSLKSELIPSIA